MATIGIIGDYQPERPSHRATDDALAHSAGALGLDLQTKWIATYALSQDGWEDRIGGFDGFFVAPGSPYKSLEGSLNAIRFAREKKRPLIGTCGGFQHVVIEFARNVLDVRDAQHAEYNPEASTLLVTSLSCSLAGKSFVVQIAPGSLAYRAYGCNQVTENYYCSFGLNPEYRAQLESAGMRTTGVEAGEEQTHGESRIIEWPEHPFYLATLFVPQIRSTKECPHPLINTFLLASTEST
jgi:CTP synthase (UTP-ammonia lyase)